MLKLGTVVDGRKVVEVKRVKSLYLSRLMLQIKEHLAEGWEIDENSFRTPVGLIMGNMVKFEEVEKPSEETNTDLNEDGSKDQESKEENQPSDETNVDQKEENTETEQPVAQETVVEEKPKEDEKPSEEKAEAPAKKTRSTKAKASE